MTGAMMLPSVTQVSHHVWLNLETLKFYCLPDNYEIIDPSLEDIKVCLISFLPFSPSSFFSLLWPLTSPPSLSLCHPPLFLPSSSFPPPTLSSLQCTLKSVLLSPLSSLQYVVSPTFSQEHVLSLHQSRKLSIALDGTKYLPGIVGLNNIKVRGGPCN